jgi:gamma-glutamylcyclotransferase (GGCT)/AIG2-like uncharacterized protein YtfP
MSTRLLATYGTLMRAFEAQARLGVEGQLSYVGPCEWTGVVYDLGRCPGAVPGAGRVQGELFRVVSSSVWTVLDAYEGYAPGREAASPFVRRRVELSAPPRTAWTYWYNGDVETAPRVPDGDWAAYVRARGDG